MQQASTPPYRWVGQLVRKNGTHGGTCALVGPRHVLTAAHCLFDKQGQVRPHMSVRMGGPYTWSTKSGASWQTWLTDTVAIIGFYCWEAFRDEPIGATFKTPIGALDMAVAILAQPSESWPCGSSGTIRILPHTSPARR